MLILSRYVQQHELDPLRHAISLEDIIAGARKVHKGLGIPIKNPLHNSTHRFFKVRIGRGARARMIVFVVANNTTIVPVLVRLKKEKILGENMSVHNPAFIQALNTSLQNIATDITSNRIIHIPLDTA